MGFRLTYLRTDLAREIRGLPSVAKSFKFILLVVWGMAVAGSPARAMEHWTDEALDHARMIVSERLVTTPDDWRAYEEAIAAQEPSAHARDLDNLVFQYLVSMQSAEFDRVFPEFEAMVDESQSSRLRNSLKLHDAFAEIMRTGDYDLTIERLQALVDEPDLTRDQRVRVRIALVYAFADNGDEVRAAENLQIAIDLANRDDIDAILQADLSNAIVYSLMGAGDYHGAIREMKRALEATRDAGLPVNGATELGNMIWMLVRANEIDTARDVDRLMLELIEFGGTGVDQFNAWAYCGLIENRANNFNEASDCFIRAGEFVVHVPERRLTWLENTAEALIRAGRVADARTYLDRLLNDERLPLNEDVQKKIPSLRAEVLRAEGRAEDAFDLLFDHYQREMERRDEESAAIAAELRALLDQEAELLSEQTLLQQEVIDRQQVIGVLFGLVAVSALVAVALMWINARRIRAAKQAAEEASAFKSQFLANMSHEIRTPLGGVLGMADALLRSGLRSDQRELVEIIKSSGNTLLAVLNDVLDLSKIEAGKFELDAAPFDLEDVVNSGRALNDLKAQEKGLALLFDVAPDAQGRYLGDAQKVSQVLNNLVSNAVKFTDSGEVRVSVSVEDSGDERSTLSVVVSDTGPGIPDDAQQRIFEAFRQEDSTIVRRHGGTGLGLAISRDLARLMDGDLTLSSVTGIGSDFKFTAVLDRLAGPTENDTALSGAELDLPAEKEISVLVAEDHPVNRKILDLILTPLGIQSTMVTNGRDAVAAYREGEFDVVLMDIRMPELGGEEALAEIRALEAQASRHRTPVIALTASAMKHEIEAFLAAGFDGHIAKPVQPELLLGTLNRVLDPSDDGQD